MEDQEQAERQRRLLRLVWRFVGLFAVIDIPLTIGVGIASGAIASAMHVTPPAWSGGLLASLCALVTAGVLFPFLQRDLREIFEPPKEAERSRRRK